MGDARPAAAAEERLDEDAARAFLERFRWPNGPVCPHCRSRGAYRLQPKTASTKPVRKGVLKCRVCRRQFTVTVGTALERTHVALSAWLLAIRQLCEDGRALNAYRLHHLTGVSYGSAHRMIRRVRRIIVRCLAHRASKPLRRGRQS